MFQFGSGSHRNMDLQSLKNPFGTLLFFMICLYGTIPSVANNPDGFLSIDCGSIQGQYTDTQTSLIWEDDGSYIRTGNIGNISQSIPSRVENSKALNTFRYFPNGLQKYCYELPTRKEHTAFLIRAMFLHGNSSILEQQLRFQVYINATRWIQVQYGFGEYYDSNLRVPTVREGMFLNHQGREVYVCLVPDKGTPFISSLELRQLDSEGSIYPEGFEDERRVGYGDFFLSNLIRLNAGVDNASLVRYPNDIYDRFWEASDDLGDVDLSFIEMPGGVNFPEINLSRTPLKNFNGLPHKTMEDGLSIRAGIPSLSVDIDLDIIDGLPWRTENLAYLVLYVHSNESNLQPSPLSLTWELDRRTQAFNISDQISVKGTPYTSDSNSTRIDFGYSNSSQGELDLLALEVYRQQRFNTATTGSFGVESAQFLKETLNMTWVWQGDPCIPRPYDGITCISTDGTLTGTWNLHSLTLSYLTNKSSLTVVPPRILEFRDLSITNSGLNDNIVQHLLNKFTMTFYLKSLNLSFNNIKDFFNNNGGYRLVQLEMLDLSHNYLTRVPSPEDFAFVFYAVYQDRRLKSVNISSNTIAGEENGLVQFLSNSTFFKKLDANDNTISGKLNLTTWYQKLWTIFQNSTTVDKSDPMFGQLFSFVNNDISDIIPSVEYFESEMDMNTFIQFFIEFEGGILLGGNPFCDSKKTLFHRFLCRSSIGDDFEGESKEKSQIPIILGVSIPGGVLLLIAGFLASFTIWRLRKQVMILREFQQELLNRNVKPPFFSYHELKSATKDFHIDNSLGKGGFGDVYKGVLQNKTEVAVKKLFNSSQQAQVLSDFLNEVVLLTGIKHKNLVQLLGCCINDNERILVYEFAERGNVGDALWGTYISPNSQNLQILNFFFFLIIVVLCCFILILFSFTFNKS